VIDEMKDDERDLDDMKDDLNDKKDFSRKANIPWRDKRKGVLLKIILLRSVIKNRLHLGPNHSSSCLIHGP
jgi:hypothetical protein